MFGRHTSTVLKGDWTRGVEFLKEQIQFSRSINDKYGVVYTLALLKGVYGNIGEWKKAHDAMAEGRAVLESMSESPSLKVKLLGPAPWALIWSGHYTEAALGIREALRIVQNMGDVERQLAVSKDLSLVLGLQTKYHKSYSYFEKVLEQYGNFGNEFISELSSALGFWGFILMKQGEMEKSEKHLSESLRIKRELQAYHGTSEVLDWLGNLFEIKAGRVKEDQSSMLTIAEGYYRQCLDLTWTGRRHFQCWALTGLLRVRHAQGQFTTLPLLLQEAQTLAQQYEYNDHLASLRLTQGHMAWDGQVSDWEAGVDAVLSYYKQALIYALRYTRFLLDEVLGGEDMATPLQPIIPTCLGRGEVGRRILIALRDWWRTGTNDTGTPRPDTISLIPEGLPLVDAERLAREHEPGDGSAQHQILESFESALAGT